MRCRAVTWNDLSKICSHFGPGIVADDVSMFRDELDVKRRGCTIGTALHVSEMASRYAQCYIVDDTCLLRHCDAIIVSLQRAIILTATLR
jgi:hypothetical protein